jgi:hypothetical protein
MLTLSCTNEQKIRVAFSPTTLTGKPAQLDGPVEVTITSGTATVEQDPAKPNEFFLVSGDSPGTSTFLVSGDADLGADVVTIEEAVTLNVSGALAANFGLVADAPIAK